MRTGTAQQLGTLVTAALLTLGAGACGTTAAPPPPAAAPTSIGGVPNRLPDVREITAGSRAITATPNPDWAVAANGSVWIAGVGPGLHRYDTTTGAVTGQVAIYSVCSAMDYGYESIWVMSCDYNSPKLVRIDAATGTASAEIAIPARLPAESSVGAGEGAVWLRTSGDPRRLIAVDPTTNTVARTLPAPDGAKAVRAGLGAVWVTTTTPGQVVRLDPTTGQTLATIKVGRDASFLAVGPDAVWAISASDATVSRIDPTTNTLTATITVSSSAVSGGDIAAAADAVWVRVTDDALAVRIDPHTNAVVDRLGPPAGSGGLAIADTSVWFTAHDAQTIWQLPR
jgi:virginiamycin B lyase